jgi:beta-glucanase (GH16 family)
MLLTEMEIIDKIMKNLLNILGIRLPKYEFKMPEGYQLKTELSECLDKSIGYAFLDLDKWRVGESWGNVQDNANCFFQLDGDKGGNSAIIEGYYMQLFVRHQEFFSTRINKQLHFKAGKIVTRDKFHYGIFRIRAKMPNFKYQWCAIWLCGKVQPDNAIWQEIDIVENYNHGKVKFASSNKIYSQPNVHFFDDGMHQMTSPSSKYVKNPDKRFVDYILWWEKDFIRIYYDNYLVYECKDKSILNQFNAPMNLIINNAVEWGVELTKEDIEEISKADTTFCISSVEYWSNKK